MPVMPCSISPNGAATKPANLTDTNPNIPHVIPKIKITLKI